MLQQLFELEMCMRETKNRTHTPLSQLPLHCLWDCLCISPLSSFQSSCSPPSRTVPLSIFLLFLVLESGLVCLASPALA